ncbi:MAG: hypothetical protein IJT56_04400, partial [Clostridia bacterium]|nr:hypothetical protein [Clostridia bacterium]
INNNVAAGFTAGPTVTTQVSNGAYYDPISMTAAQTGTVYFLYTTTPASYTSGLQVAQNVNNSNGGSMSVTANTPASNLITATTVNTATAVVFTLATTAGYSNPVTVYRTAGMNTGTNTNSGYGMSKASLNTITGNVEVRATVNGYLYYYYTNSAAVNMTANDMRNYGTYTNANTLGDVSVPGNNGYAYVWLMMYDGMNSYAPYRVQLSTSGGTNTGTGTSTNPSSGINHLEVKGTILYTPSADGILYYYITNSSTAPNANVYLDSWISVQENGGVASSVTAKKSTTAEIPYDTANSGKYMVIQLRAGSNNIYAPEVIKLP